MTTLPRRSSKMSGPTAQFYQTSTELLDALKLKLGARSDAEVARALGVKRAAAGHWRTGRSSFSPKVAEKAAEILGLDSAPIILAQLACAERDASLKRVYSAAARMWSTRVGKLPKKSAAAVLALLCGMAGFSGFAPLPAQARASDSATDSVYYVKET